MAAGPSVLKRFALTFTHVITGSLFFYVVLVGMSYYSKGTVLDLLPYNAWSRMASRATGAAALFPFAFQLVSSPASLWSLFWATWTCCAFAVHMMIVATDTNMLEDPAYHAELVRQGAHPLLSLLPRRLALALGTLAYVALVLCGLERTYGGALGRRQRTYPAWVLACLAYISAVYAAWFGDRLANAVSQQLGGEEVAYPAAFLALLAAAGAVAVRRNRGACAAAVCAAAKVGEKPAQAKKNE